MTRSSRSSPTKATPRRTPALRVRLKAAKAALKAAELRFQHGRIDEAAALAAAMVSPAKVTRPDGSMEAMVIAGLWLIDADAGIDGPAIVCRVGSGAPITTLLQHSESEQLGPDIAPGDRVLVKPVCSRQHKFLGVLQAAAKRQPCNWLTYWKRAFVPELRTVGEFA
ncbi:hypothetical protein [Hydrocarboniphaga sp.]|uniref:hypothetical protein n=1 Tax=Hydrocarboniphaga sp. TaxID=2033016 RepID=UPI003D13E28D